MKKHGIRLLSLLLSAAVIFGAVSVGAYAENSSEVDTHLQFNIDGSFEIMQISDIQNLYPISSLTKKLLIQAVDVEQPDLIVLTGDNINAFTVLKPIAKAAINEFMEIFEQRNIPVAMVFGNHDCQNTFADKAYQLSVYEQYDCFIGCAGEDFGEDNLGTYYVPIYSSSDRDEMKFNLWMIDSGASNVENNLGGYGCTKKSQIEWYERTSAQLEKQNGGKVPSLMFQHIVVPEIYDILTEVPYGTEDAVYRDGKYYVLPEGAKGQLNEAPCPPNYSNGQLDSVIRRGDVLAMFFGHDHTNSFEIAHEGVDLINTPGVGFGLFTYNGDEVGVRMINLNESDLQKYETHLVTYFDLFDYNDNDALLLYKIHSSTSSFQTVIACFFKYIASHIGFSVA